jgi:hypothetical protein
MNAFWLDDVDEDPDDPGFYEDDDEDDEDPDDEDEDEEVETWQVSHLDTVP